MKLQFRQGIVRHQTDINGNPTFLDLNGTTVDLVVSPDPTILTFAHRASNYLFIENNTVNNAWNVSGGANRWLYWDIDIVTGVRTFGATNFEPIETSQAPLNPVIDQHWFDTNTTTMKVWNGYKWVEVIRVFAAKYDALGNTLISTSINSPSFLGTQVGLTVPVTAGALLFDVDGFPLKRNDGRFHTTEDAFLTGINSSARVRLETIDIEAIAQTPLSAFTVVEFYAFNKIVASSPFSLKVRGIIEEDASTGETVKVVMEGLVRNPNWNWSQVNASVYTDAGGVLVTTPAVTNQDPIGTVIDSTTILLRQSRLVTNSVGLIATEDLSDGDTVVTSTSLGTDLGPSGSNDRTIGGGPYTNGTGAPLTLYVTVGSITASSSIIEIDGVAISQFVTTSGTTTATHTVTVPAGSTYQLIGGGSIISWFEAQ